MEQIVVKPEIVKKGIRVVRGDKFVPNLWSVFEPKVSVALEHSLGEVTADDLKCRIIDGNAQLWLIIELPALELEQAIVAVAITEIVQYDQLSSLRVITLGGANMARWARDLDNALVSFARGQGSTRMEAVGRAGLGRKLAHLAFLPSYTVYTKEIPHE